MTLRGRPVILKTYNEPKTFPELPVEACNLRREGGVTIGYYWPDDENEEYEESWIRSWV